LYGLFIIVLPTFSFWVIPSLKPEWQSGEMDAYLVLLLQPEASIFFLALLAYSIICYSLLLIDADRFSPFFVVRLGIYTGVFLALQYTIILGLYLFGDKNSFLLLLLWFFPLYFPKIYRWAVNKWDRKKTLSAIFLFFAVAFVISAIISRQVFTPILLVWVGLLAAAPFWSFLIAARAAIWLYKNYESKLTPLHGLGITAWLASYAVAWRYDILKMYELYTQLPPQPPDCYIATAAAHGHLRFVRAWTVWREDGKRMRVNRQLQLLKCAELALLAICPRWHKLLRRAYDGIGKSLARRIQNPFLADLAYLCLKPFESLAGIILKLIIPEIDLISSKMYTK
jgi:hypothetical protein